jgi:hypothetical protein
MAISDSPAAETARRHFHWCLAAVILPVITLPLEWAAALAHRRDRGTSEDRRRSRRLFALAVADTIVAALVIGLVASGVWSWRTLIQRPSTAARPEPVRIGATLAANPQRHDEAQIMQIAIDSPAERAGLKAGDALIAIDGVPIRDLHGEDGSKSIPAPVLVYGRDDGGRIAINPISGASAIRWPFR